MGAQDGEETTSEEQHTDTQEEQDTSDQKREHSAEDVELSEEGREKVNKMLEAYKDKPTAVLPGTHGTVTGTAINDWLDDEGNPKFGDPKEHPFAEDQDENKGDGP